MMDARKKEEILSPPFDALPYAAVMKVEMVNRESQWLLPFTSPS